MFALALFVSFMVVGMIFAAPFANAFKAASYEIPDTFTFDQPAPLVKSKSYEPEVCTLVGYAAVPLHMIKPRKDQTLRGFPAAAPFDAPSEGVKVDAGVRCHPSVTYTPHH